MKSNWQFVVLLCAGVLLLTLGLLELGSRAYFSAFGHSYQVRQSFFEQRVLDPFLGWSKNPSFTEYSFGQGRPLSLIALGGSTTDSLYMPENWVRQLGRLCGANSRRACQVRNGGVSGYNSTQELIKLQRDVVPLRPDIVIVLDGINDGVLNAPGNNTFSYTQSAERMGALRGITSELFSPMHAQHAEGSLLPGLFRMFYALRASVGPNNSLFSVDFGYPDHFSAAERWEHNVRMMQATAREFGLKFLVVLQPFSGTIPESFVAARAKVGLDSNEPWVREDQQRWARYYTDLRAACRRLNYCLDISHAFDDPALRKHWTDPAHVDQEGHRKEAEQIFSELKRRRWL